jgi:GTP-dependent phosphoenolpyruvate carboxykinase
MPAQMKPIVLHRFPAHTAPKGAPVLVAGGIAMRKTGGEWYSGMEDPPFSRQLNWEPKWWAAIPQQNDD